MMLASEGVYGKSKHWLWLPVVLGALIFAGGAVARAAGAPAHPPPLQSHASGPAVPCSTLSFAPPVTYTTGTRPRSATTGDFNHDTHIDLVVTNYSANSV